MGEHALMTTDTQHDTASTDGPLSTTFQYARYLSVLWNHRIWLAKVTALGFLVAIGIALLIPSEYKSTVELMPPDQQSVANTSMLTGLGGPTTLVPSVSGGLMSQRTPGATFIGILSSRTAMDDIINRFDLRKVYHTKTYLNTRKILAKRSAFDEDKKSGIITITVMDHDPNRARDIAQAYIDELGKLLSTLTTSSARRERIFLEERLKSIKSDVDATSQEFSQFSSRNATLDVQNEGQAILGSAGRLQGELIAAESELSGLRAQYADDNTRVRTARARINSLQSQLRAMSGAGTDTNAADLTADQFYPSLRKLPLLGVTYFDLYHRLTMQQTIYELLSRQYELAKVQEAKDIPPVKVLDEPLPAEKKTFPPRTIIVLFTAFMSLILGMVWLLVRQFLRDSGRESLIPASWVHAFRAANEHSAPPHF
jgi:uncharacterized protein involved in exopolysaccharide biosynthesis